MNGRDDTPQIRIAHRLLRARDWQDRPQRDDLCDWWRSGAGGVCALVGIGGAGKTAIADRFVRALPGVLLSPDVTDDDTLRPPRGLFVFSFYDAPNPDTFFVELAAWLSRKPLDEESLPPSYTQTRMLLEETAGVLLVLDGLEKIQASGERGSPLGRILDGRLRDLVLRAADGCLPGVRLLITSRFRLFDALSEGSQGFRQILVEELTAEASVKLLRRRGVHGPDHRLEALAGDQGFHALSVDLIGGYVAIFRDGDPSRLPPEPRIPQDAEDDVALDPRIAALRKQELRFARLAERYAEALRDSDPAALALLQRVCLFRLGVDAVTLASIFTGEGKDVVAGPELAKLDATGLQAKLALLAEMKLLERDEDERFSVHPAVRDGFLKTLDEETSRLGHEAARERLQVSLGDRPGANPSDPATLDLLEEIAHHTLAAGHGEEAFALYWNRIGGYRNLGWRLGAYERGERICRAFAGGRQPEDAPLPERLPENDQVTFVNEWALYLTDLGRLDAVARCFQRYIESSLPRDDWENASIGNQNVTDVMLLAGRLTAASEAAEEALGLAERADDASGRSKSYAYRGHVRASRGETPGALDDFRDALHWQHEYEKQSDRPLWSLLGVLHTLLLARMGRNEEATRLAEANMEICADLFGESQPWTPRCKLILADLARERHDLDAARQLLDAANEWAITRDAKEPLCWAALVRARLERSRVRIAHRSPSGDRPQGAACAPYDDARRALEDGLRIARDCGYGIYHIDLLLLRARLALEQGDADQTITDVNVALFEGVQPPESSGQPKLLAAGDPECGYAWGEAEGRQLRSEALLVRAARSLGRGDFVPARAGELPEEVRGLIGEARQELEACRLLREKIRDPKVAETEEMLAQLDGGVLTQHPLEPARDVPEDTGPAEEPSLQTEEATTMTQNFDVFLSHNSSEKAAVFELGNALKARGLTVWLAQWEIAPGRPWQEALEQIIGTTRSAAVLVGKDGLGPWNDRAMRACLSQFVDRGLPVIPVLMPGTRKQPDLPLFLGQFTWVDLRGGLTEETLDRLEWGITGVKPGSSRPTVSRPEVPPRASEPAAIVELSTEGPKAECRILFLAANPAGARLALDEEVREIETKIRTAEHRDTLRLISKWAVRPDDLLQSLNQHRPHIVHFSGHGSPGEEIVLQDPNGGA